MTHLVRIMASSVNDMESEPELDIHHPDRNGLKPEQAGRSGIQLSVAVGLSICLADKKIQCTVSTVNYAIKILPVIIKALVI